MKIEIFDSYNIRARICPSIILLSPIALTLFLCFKDTFNAYCSAVIIVMLLSFANSLPIIQRIMFRNSRFTQVNYAAQYLSINDKTIDSITKKRFYSILSDHNTEFRKLYTYTNSIEYKQLCESAVTLIKNKTRDNKMILEENINYGFSKNMNIIKPYGIIVCSIDIVFIVVYSLISNETIKSIPRENWISLIINLIILLFWLFVITKQIIQESGKRYGLTLIESIDSLQSKCQ